MSSTVAEVRQALASGQCLLCVLSSDAFGIARSLGESDPSPDAAGRPVWYWDHEDGFSVATGVSSIPEGLDDFLRALDYAGKFTGAGVFVFNLDEVSFAEEEKAIRRQLKTMASRFTPADKRALILAGGNPVPRTVAQLFTTVGYEAAEPAREKAPPAAPRPGGPWREIRQIEKFDSPAWRRRLDTLSEQQIQEIIRGEHHKEALRRVSDLRRALKAQFARKDAIIDLMTYATVAQVPMVLLGPPGTAKSNLVRNFCEGMGLSALKTRQATTEEQLDNPDREPTGGFFEYLLTRYTTPEEIFGPVHVPDLINKQLYRRVTAGRLPESEIAFLDEIFKASSAIVNTLLAILNEHLFHNAGRVQKVPLVMVFAASNEPPQDPNLGALYDRFPIRANCGRVDDEHVGELWQRSWELSFDRGFHVQRLSMDQVSCTNDFRLLHLVSLAALGGRGVEAARGLGRLDFGAEFLRIFRSLRRDFDISDRTLHVLYGLARARALVEDRADFSAEDLDVFRNVSWDESGTGELDRLVVNLKRGISL